MVTSARAGQSTESVGVLKKKLEHAGLAIAASWVTMPVVRARINRRQALFFPRRTVRSLRDRLHDRACIALVTRGRCPSTPCSALPIRSFSRQRYPGDASEFVIISFARFSRATGSSILSVVAPGVVCRADAWPCGRLLIRKPCRTFLIPVAFYCRGRRRPHWLDRQIGLSAGVIAWVVSVCFRISGRLLPSRVTHIIPIMWARGTVAPADCPARRGALFASGVRPDSRTLLSSLVRIACRRVSEADLDLNFCAILYICALCRPVCAGMSRLLCRPSSIVLADRVSVPIPASPATGRLACSCTVCHGCSAGSACPLVMMVCRPGDLVIRKHAGWIGPTTFRAVSCGPRGF